MFFTLNLDNNLGMMSLDQDGVRQILNNLIGNASDALEGVEDAKISISTQGEKEQNQNGVSIIIEDNGPGISPDVAKHIFEPYVTTKAKGTGLGMAIVKRITQAHGGSVVVNSQSPGGHVKVWLPAKAGTSENN